VNSTVRHEVITVLVVPDKWYFIYINMTNIEVLKNATTNLELQSDFVIEGLYINDTVGIFLPLDFLQDLLIDIEELEERCGEIE
jgi:hypothetical protein